MDISIDLKDFFDTAYDMGSLAFLGLTTKVENPFRDQFAYYLYKKYSSSLKISREYSNGQNLRVDLAMLEGNNKYLIEFKACYSFDLLRYDYKLYQTQIFKDRDKYADKDLFNVTYILLSIRTEICPINNYKDVIKYYGDMVKAFDNYTSDQQKNLSFDSVNRWFDGNDGLKVKSSGSFDLGKAYGVNVYLDYFIIE
jgi:hypothetical protein